MRQLDPHGTWLDDILKPIVCMHAQFRLLEHSFSRQVNDSSFGLRGLFGRQY